MGNATQLNRFNVYKILDKYTRSFLQHDPKSLENRYNLLRTLFGTLSTTFSAYENNNLTRNQQFVLLSIKVKVNFRFDHLECCNSVSFT